MAVAIGKVAAQFPDFRVASFYTTNGNEAYVSDDRRTTFATFYPPGQQGFDAENFMGEIRNAFAEAVPPGVDVHLTGRDALYESEGGDSDGPSVLTEALIGGLGATIILLFVFGTLPAVVIPILMAIASILNTFTLIWLLTYITSVSLIVQFLVALVGLGVAIDYALLMIFRFRDELRHGADTETALVETMTHAGRAVIVSGSTVAIGLFSMVFLPVPVIRSIGIGGLLIPIVSVCAAITFLPAMLALLGPRINSVRVMPKRIVEGTDEERGFWWRWSHFVMRHPLITGGIGIAIVALLMIPAIQLNAAEAQVKDLAGAETEDAVIGLQRLTDAGITHGVTKPFVVLVEGNGSPAAAETVAERLAETEGLAGAAVPDGWRNAAEPARRGVPGRGRCGEAGPRHDRQSPGRRAAAARSGSSATPRRLTLGGIAPEDRDFVHAVYGKFPLVLTFVIVLTLILLMRAFRSVVPQREGGHPQPAVPGRRLRDHRLHLPAGPWLGGDLGRAPDGRDHLLDPADDLRVPLRAVDGLRGVHGQPHAGGVRRDRRHEVGDRPRPRAYREARYERRSRSDVRVLRPLHEPRRRT